MLSLIASLALSAPAELVYLDPKGVVRWTKDKKEVALFGANYCLPTALDYRAAKAVGADMKKLIRQDMTHFARMGWDALRFSFWGDWESSDAEGNLVANDRLDLLDYTLAEAKKRGIYFLLSPIVTYDARWPEMKEYPEARGFSRKYDRGKLGTDPDALKAQVNYLRQILNHVNPYTGVALKDEPSILFVEMINEPWHHPEVGTKYVDALVDAVRSTGCKKLTFHNVSQDFRMAPILRDSKVDGTTFGWYPSGLNANHELKGNFLRYVDDYPAMRDPVLATKPRIVYEFDMPDTNTGYAYPAMTRAFRSGGMQMACMFSYDMLATAPTNLGWTTHLLNLVYTPKKAASAVIAAEAMRRLPAGKTYGAYPANRRFGDFRVSYEEDLAELVTNDVFMYSNDTKSPPPSPKSLKKIVGYGSSPVVRYKGSGIYFLDKLRDGLWRLELYPDIDQIDDPFTDPSRDRLKFALMRRTRPMRITLPDLGSDFSVEAIDVGNSLKAKAKAAGVIVRPGVYLLRGPKAGKAAVPSRVGHLGLREFVCPPDTPGGIRETMPLAGPSTLFDPERDVPMLSASRSGEARNGPGRLVNGSAEGKKALALSTAARPPEDFSVSLYVGDRKLSGSKLCVRLRGRAEGAKLRVVLVDRDGAAWAAVIPSTTDWQIIEVPLSAMKPSRWALLPQGFPGTWSYWADQPLGAHTLAPSKVERLQFSLRREDGAVSQGVEIEGASFVP
ncbi:hypothetical protein EON82_18285 [bacterium]|nr:MAG: hypothetical protein EON82_18285 [bacterium]